MNGRGRDRLLAQLEAVHLLTAATVSAATVESICEAALDALISVLDADRAAVLLFDGDHVMRFRAWRGLSERYRASAEGHSPWSRESRNPEPVVIADVVGDARLGPLRPVVLAEGIAALAFVPLVYGDQLLGKFMIYSNRPRDFDTAELSLAATVASHVAFALEKRRLESQLSATLNAVSEAITVQSPDGRLLLANQAAAALLGYQSVDELLAAGLGAVRERFEMCDLEGHPLPPEALPGRAALRGERLPEVLIRWRDLSGDRDERFSLVRGHPVFDDTGAIQFAVNVFRDVTERQQAVEKLRASEARLAFLASAGRRLLGTALDAAEVLQVVVDLIVPELGDWCAIRELGSGGAPQRVAIGYLDAAAEIIAGLDSYGDVLAASPAMEALRQGRSILLDAVPPAMLEAAAVDADHLALLRRLDLRSAMLVPLRTRGRTVGVLTVAGGSTRAAYNDADLALIEELAARVAATVENARSFEREHAAADTLARALLPGRLPEIDGLEVAARYRPAGDVGGDFYDCFPDGHGGWMIVLGDVCGRGIAAAAMTGMTRHSIRAVARHADSLPALLADVNALLVEAAGEDDDAEPSFCTVCMAQVAVADGGAEVSVAAAGHPLPYVVRADGTVAEIGTPGSLLGLLGDIDSVAVTVQLGAGDALVLYTDGITERRQQRQFFADRLPGTLRGGAALPAAALAERIENAAVSFSATTADDDMAVVVISVPAVAHSAGPPTPTDDPASRRGSEMSDA